MTTTEFGDGDPVTKGERARQHQEIFILLVPNQKKRDQHYSKKYVWINWFQIL